MTKSIQKRFRAMLCLALALLFLIHTFSLHEIEAESDGMPRSIPSLTDNGVMYPFSTRRNELFRSVAGDIYSDLDILPDIFEDAISVKSVPSEEAAEKISCSSHGEEFRLLDVPLSENQQRYVWGVAEEFGIDPIMIYGIMHAETRYKVGINSKNGKYIGVMQIAKSGLKALTKKVGVTDLEDFEQNVRAGAYFISYYHKKHGCDVNKILMCYHCGGSGARSRWNDGIFEDGYCRKVRGEMERILSDSLSLPT